MTGMGEEREGVKDPNKSGMVVWTGEESHVHASPCW